MVKSLFQVYLTYFSTVLHDLRVKIMQNFAPDIMNTIPAGYPWWVRVFVRVEKSVPLPYPRVPLGTIPAGLPIPVLFTTGKNPLEKGAVKTANACQSKWGKVRNIAYFMGLLLIS